MSPISLLTEIDGRIGRARFWLGTLIVLAALVGIGHFARQVVPEEADRVAAFANAFALFPWSALAAKRATDRGGAPAFGILLVCAIVLPDLAKQLLPFAWHASLDTIAIMAWVVALIDLGLLPGVTRRDPVAAATAGAKAPAWTPSHSPSISTPSTPSR